MEEHTQRYISKELTHIIGRELNNDKEKQYGLLNKILNEEWLKHFPYDLSKFGNLEINSKVKMSENGMYTPDVICFCDIPIQDLSIHINKFKSSFGLSFNKSFIVENGGCPVFYIPKQSKVRSRLKEGFPNKDMLSIIEKDGYSAIHDHIHKGICFDQAMLKYKELFFSNNPKEADNWQLMNEIFNFLNFHIFSLIKFYDSSLPDNDDVNYYFEREWRVIGHLKFKIKDIKTIFIPKEYAERFRKDFPDYLGQLIFVD